MAWNRRTFIKTNAGAVAGLWLAGCRGKPAEDDAASDAIVFHNGVVLPVDAGFSEHTALAIRGNRVLAVGGYEEVADAAGRGARLIDLDGRTVLPGFIEPHCTSCSWLGWGT